MAKKGLLSVEKKRRRYQSGRFNKHVFRKIERNKTRYRATDISGRSEIRADLRMAVQYYLSNECVDGCVDELSEEPEIPRRVYKWRIIWSTTVVFFVLHLGALYGWYLFFTSCMALTMIWSWVLVYSSGIGITMGAHRFYSHRAFKCNDWIRALLLILQTIAGQRSMYTWVRDHRVHHKYSDTDGDPHNATRGFFFSHVGWLLIRRHRKVVEGLNKIYLTDLEMDSFVMFQKKYYILLFTVLNLLVSMLVPHVLWGESMWNGFFVCFMCRLVTSMHLTFLVNSAAHAYGNKPFTKDIMPAENAWVSLVALGEGWHNYHHTFPWDYRAAELGQWLNVTTKLIDFLARRGWVWDMKMATSAMVHSRVVKYGDGTRCECAVAAGEGRPRDQSVAVQRRDRCGDSDLSAEGTEKKRFLSSRTG